MMVMMATMTLVTMYNSGDDADRDLSSKSDELSILCQRLGPELFLLLLDMLRELVPGLRIFGRRLITHTHTNML